MVHHFSGQTTLKIKNQGNTRQTGQDAANKSALVHMAVNDVRFDPQIYQQRFPGQVDVKGQLVTG